MTPAHAFLWFLGIVGGTVLGKKIRAWYASRGELTGSNDTSDISDDAGSAAEAGTCANVLSKKRTNASEKPYAGDKPIAGRASVGTYQWIYKVRKNETPGSIAKDITGDSRRYVEILSANSDRRMATYKLGTRVEVNFAKGDFCEGDSIYIPKSMNPWIDETGQFAYGDAHLSHAFPPFDALPNYPQLESGITAGFIPWPPSAPTGWGAIPMPPLPSYGPATSGSSGRSR